MRTLEEMEAPKKLSTNDEIVTYEGIRIPLRDHLAVNKRCRMARSDRELPEARHECFFKNFKGRLQVHVKVFTAPNQSKWLWFDVHDATEKEREFNQRLNVTME